MFRCGLHSTPPNHYYRTRALRALFLFRWFTVLSFLPALNPQGRRLAVTVTNEVSRRLRGYMRNTLHF